MFPVKTTLSAMVATIALAGCATGTSHSRYDDDDHYHGRSRAVVYDEHRHYDGDRRFYRAADGRYHRVDNGYGDGRYDRGSDQVRHGDHDDRRDVGNRSNRSIDERQQAQKKRIANEAKQGDLTAKEREDLLAEQREIDRRQNRYMRDGRLSKDERRELDQELKESSRNINRQANDGQSRGDRN